MAKVLKKAKKVRTDTNGEDKSARKAAKFEEASSYIAEAYPQLMQSMQRVLQQMEVVTPGDARPVNGWARTMLTRKTQERLAEKQAFESEKKRAKLSAKRARLADKLAEIESAISELQA